ASIFFIGFPPPWLARPRRRGLASLLLAGSMPSPAWAGNRLRIRCLGPARRDNRKAAEHKLSSLPVWWSRELTCPRADAKILFNRRNLGSRRGSRRGL